MNKTVFNNLANFSKKLDDEKFSEFIYSIRHLIDDKTINELKKNYGHRNMAAILSFNNNADLIDDQIFNNQFHRDFLKYNYIFKDAELLSQINGCKLLIYGPTGTGKTTFAKKIIELNKDIKEYSIEFATLISSRMGQTQLNLFNLANELNKEDSRTFLFIDEFDSIINDRASSDIGEHKRIIGMFNKFLDMLNENIILIAATNYINHIDSAILRRFNLKMETKKFDLKFLLKMLKSINFVLSIEEEENIEFSLLEREFSFSDFYNFKSNYLIDQKIGLIDNDYKYFLNFFKNKINIEKINISGK